MVTFVHLILAFLCCLFGAFFLMCFGIDIEKSDAKSGGVMVALAAVFLLAALCFSFLAGAA